MDEAVEIELKKTWDSKQIQKICMVQMSLMIWLNSDKQHVIEFGFCAKFSSEFFTKKKFLSTNAKFYMRIFCPPLFQERRSIGKDIKIWGIDIFN